MTARRFAAALGALALLALLGAERARFAQWTTSDEPAHLAAAREWKNGPGMVSNFEHPVLMKVLAGAFLPASRPDLEIEETRAGRAPFPFVLGGLVLATGLLGRAVAGPAAGLAAAALIAVEPTFRGHGPLVQSDVLVTLFLVAAAWALETSARAPRGTRAARLWLVASGVLYGIAMASKYSAFPFLAVFALVAAVRLGTRQEDFSSNGEERAPRRRIARKDQSQRAGGDQGLLPSKKFFVLSSFVPVLLWLVLPALLTLALVQSLAFAGTSDEAFRAGIAAAFRDLPQESAALALAARFPKWIAGYGAGLLFVEGVAGPGERFNYFLGEVRGTGWFFYFPVALAIKLTAAAVLGTLAAVAAGAAALVRGARRGAVVARAWLPFVLGSAYLGAACLSNVNIGVRHAFPAVPFLLVAAAACAATLLESRPRVLLATFAGVFLLSASESAAALRREIAFGNVLVGGPKGVPRVLSDSNVDWGQEQGLVFDRARRGDLGRVAMATLLVDESSAKRAGIAGIAMRPDADVDTVFFSRFLWDLAAAAEKNAEPYSKFVWLRGWLPPLRRGLEARAASIEPFGDCYLLLKLKPVTAARPPAPGPTP